MLTLLLQGWFLAGCAFMLVVMYGLLYHGKNAAYTKSNEVCL